MALLDQIKKLAAEKSTPCVTISLNTHRTHPDNTHDVVLLKNLLKEAEERVIAEFGKRPVAALLEKLSGLAGEINENHNLDSLHIFLSNDTKEIIKSPWPSSNQGVHISDSFALRSIMKTYNRSENYLLMLLSQTGVHLFEAMNDGIIHEIHTDEFPFPENQHYNTNHEKASDAKHLDNLVREFLNKVDKALVKVHAQTGLNCVVICTEENYTMLQQVADKPSIYLGYAPVNYNKTATHDIVKQSWEVIKSLQFDRRTRAIGEMKEAVANGKVLTDLQDIYRAAIDGQGDMLIVHQDFQQAVVMKDDRSFDLVDDATTPHAIDDITSTIAWEVLSKKGRIFFTSQDEIKDLGKIVLKTRY
jgi:hypothetical protein